METFWVRESEIGQNANNFWGKISPSNFEFDEKFAGNFPKTRRTTVKNSAQIRSAEPWAQDLGSTAGISEKLGFGVVCGNLGAQILKAFAKTCTAPIL